MLAPDRLRDLHAGDTFVILNAWDSGSARLFAALGAPALATTSSGFAATLGRADQHLTRDELAEHVRDLVAAVDVPVSIDAEDGYAAEPSGVADTVGMLADAGAAGISIEDWDAAAGRTRDVSDATDRVAAAVGAAGVGGPVVIARCENALYDSGDLEDTVSRLAAYRDAGAEMVYAPGLTAADDLRQIVALGIPVNALLLPGGPSVRELSDLGVRRVSVGGALAWTAYGAAVEAARALLRPDASADDLGSLDRDLRASALSDR